MEFESDSESSLCDETERKREGEREALLSVREEGTKEKERESVCSRWKNEREKKAFLFFEFFAFSLLCSPSTSPNQPPSLSSKESNHGAFLLSPVSQRRLQPPFATSPCTSRRCVDVSRARWSPNWTSHAHASAGCGGARGDGERAKKAAAAALLDRPPSPEPARLLFVFSLPPKQRARRTGGISMHTRSIRNKA